MTGRTGVSIHTICLSLLLPCLAGVAHAVDGDGPWQLRFTDDFERETTGEWEAYDVEVLDWESDEAVQGPGLLSDRQPCWDPASFVRIPRLPTDYSALRAVSVIECPARCAVVPSRVATHSVSRTAASARLSVLRKSHP